MSDIRRGDIVRLTSKFLRNTGQYTSRDSRSKWHVIDVDGDFALVDEPQHDAASWYTPDEIESLSVNYGGRTFVPRRINVNNLIRVTRPDHS